MVYLGFVRYVHEFPDLNRFLLFNTKSCNACQSAFSSGLFCTRIPDCRIYNASLKVGKYKKVVFKTADKKGDFQLEREREIERER